MPGHYDMTLSLKPSKNDMMVGEQFAQASNSAPKKKKTNQIPHDVNMDNMDEFNNTPFGRDMIRAIIEQSRRNPDKVNPTEIFMRNMRK